MSPVHFIAVVWRHERIQKEILTILVTKKPKTNFLVTPCHSCYQKNILKWIRECYLIIRGFKKIEGYNLRKLKRFQPPPRIALPR